MQTSSRESGAADLFTTDADKLLSVSGTYLTAWLPYGIICVWATFGDPAAIPKLLFPLLSFFAKLSFVCNPIVYIGLNKNYRLVLVHQLHVYTLRPVIGPSVYDIVNTGVFITFKKLIMLNVAG